MLRDSMLDTHTILYLQAYICRPAYIDTVHTYCTFKQAYRHVYILYHIIFRPTTKSEHASHRAPLSSQRNTRKNQGIWEDASAEFLYSASEFQLSFMDVLVPQKDIFTFLY